MNKYEQLIEHIINDNEEAAKALFHQIVVEKSRDIYESLMDEEQVEENFGGNPAQNFVQDVQSDVQHDETEGIGEDDEDGEEFDLGGGDDDEEVDGEEFSDNGEETFGDVEGNDDSVSGKIDELEAQLAELKAMLDVDGDGDHDTEDHGMESDMDSDFDGSDAGEESGMEDAGMFEAKSGSGNPFAKSGSGKSGSGKSGSGMSGSGKSGSGMKESRKLSDVEIMKEYVDKIGEIYKQEPASGEGKTVGTGGDAPTVNKTSVGLSKGPDFGGTSANIARGGANPDPSGTPSAKTGGVLKQGGEIDVAKRNVNKPGGNKGAQDWYGKKETSYEKNKGAEGQTTDGKVSVDTKSLLKHIGK